MLLLATIALLAEAEKKKERVHTSTMRLSSQTGFVTTTIRYDCHKMIDIKRKKQNERRADKR